MKRIVPDTNVLVSVTISPGGPPERIYHAWKSGNIEICSSPVLLSELKGVLLRPGVQKYHCMSREKVNKFISLLLKGAILGTGEKKVNVIEEDPDDDYVLSAAMETNSDFIVSGDRHLLELKSFQGIKTVTPSEFLKQIEE